MKLSSLIAVCAASVALTAQAKTAGELRIYIDPGHGGYTSGDRPLPIIGYGGNDGEDTIKFYESNTNLQKGFGVLEKLVDMGFSFNRSWGARNFGNNVVMSRNANWETNLATVREEVDVNNFDMFLSIHSNAPGGSEDWKATNYPLMIYRGYTNPKAETSFYGTYYGNNLLSLDIQQKSRAMSKCMWNRIIENPHQHWNAYNTESSAYLAGDVDFYGYANCTASGTSKGAALGYLGVLRHHVPGLLSEGFFHTYAPARHRAMNWDVCRVEGASYARGIADYFGLPRDTKGIIYGIVRDADEQFYQDPYTHNYQNNDKFRPLNGVDITLRDAGGQVVACYATDDFHNGAFVFNVQPGTYTATFVKEGYGDLEQTFTVGADQTVYPEVWMHKGTSSYHFIEYNYPDPLKDTGLEGGGTQYSIRHEYEDVYIPELGGRWPRRVFARNGMVYIHGVNGSGSNPVLLVYDGDAQCTVRQLSLNGINTDGTTRPIGDMAVTNDGHVVVCTEHFCQSGDDQASSAGVSRGYTRFYYWENAADGLPTGDPKELFSSSVSGWWYRANSGHAFSFSGNLTRGVIVQSAINVYPGGSDIIRYNVFKIRNHRLVEEGKYLSNVDDYSKYSSLGELFTMLPSPGHPDYICINSRQNEARQYYVDIDGHNLNSWCKIPDSALGQGAYGTGYFRFGNHNYQVQPDNNANGENYGIKLNSCGDYGNAVRVALDNWSLPTVAVDGYAAADGEGRVDRDDSGNPVAGYINMFLVRDGKITKFTSRPEDQETGVGDIIADGVNDSEAAPVYYNLNGVRVGADSLTPGLYIRVQGAEARKIVVR